MHTPPSFKRIWPILLGALGNCWVALADDARSEILKQYHRSTEATQLKYLDGIYCIRDPKFKLINQEGMTLDLNVERTRMEQFLDPALKVEEKLTLQSFQQPDPGRAVCNVTYTTKITIHNRLTDKDNQQVMTTLCQDEWTLTNKGWKLLTSRVTDQEYRR